MTGSCGLPKCAMVGFPFAALPSSLDVALEACSTPQWEGNPRNKTVSALGQCPKGDVWHPVGGTYGSA